MAERVSIACCKPSERHAWWPGLESRLSSGRSETTIAAGTKAYLRLYLVRHRVPRS